MTEIELTDSNFKEHVAGETPILVDFWAPWCGPCKAVAPLVAEIAKTYEGRLRVGKLDIDESEVVAEKYGVASIPMFLVFKKGKVIGSAMGAMPKSDMKNWIEGVLE